MYLVCVKVSFIGLVVIGEKVQQLVSVLGKWVIFELGGKNVVLFFDDLMLEVMVNGIIEVGYLNQGQICVVVECFYLLQGKLDVVLVLLKDKFSVFVLGLLLDEWMLMGLLVNCQQYDKVLWFIQIVCDEGDIIVCGGEVLLGEGYFLQLIVVKVCSEESILMCEEIFGLVCSFIGYCSEEEVLV